MLLDVIHDVRGLEVGHAQFEEADCRRREVALDRSVYEVDVVTPAEELADRLLDVCAGALDDQHDVRNGGSDIVANGVEPTNGRVRAGRRIPADPSGAEGAGRQDAAKAGVD